MGSNIAAANRGWPNKMLGAVLVLLGLVGMGLPSSRAQLTYNGGSLEADNEPDERDSAPAVRQQGSRAAAPVILPPSLFPDADFYYPFYDPATTTVTRSYYPGGEPGQPLSLAIAGFRFHVSQSALPWNQAGFKDYDEPAEAVRDATLFPPRKYALKAAPQRPLWQADTAQAALLIAHLPENAAFWVQGTRTGSTGRTRYFHSPPLLPGRAYRYTISAAWTEDGRWVRQTEKIPVRAGTIETIYLRPRKSRLK